MTEPIQACVVDLSHWDPADDYEAVKADGILGVIYKATEGQGYTDPTYVGQQQAAKAAGLLWGAYHFADASNVSGQVANFMRYVCPDPDELFCLDWEDNPSGAGKMSVAQAQQWIEQVETELGRPNECVLYGGNTIKEALSDDPEGFWGARRLWLCQYGSTPSWPEDIWESYWLWQFTDGQVGPSPHTVDGIGPCDINSYDGDLKQLVAEWASGSAKPVPAPPKPSLDQVSVLVAAPSGITVKIRQIQFGQGISRKSFRVHRGKEAL